MWHIGVDFTSANDTRNAYHIFRSIEEPFPSVSIIIITPLINIACESLTRNDHSGFTILNWLYGCAIPLKYMVQGKYIYHQAAATLEAYIHKFPKSIYLSDGDNYAKIETKDAFKFG